MTKKSLPPATIEVDGAEIAAAVRGWLAGWKPRPKQTLSEWSAEHARLDNGKRFRAYPFQRDIADAFTDPRTRFITVKKSSRVGYSQLVQNFVAYTIAQQPRRLLIYQPTIDDAKKYSRDDLEPVLQWPAVRAVAEFKPRHRDNQITAKRFKGGWIQIKGTNSPKEFRRVTCDVVLLEEPDGYPQSSGVEGDPGELAYRRNTTSDEPLSAAGSTPILAGLSRIDALFMEGTQEYRFVPCPQCGQIQKLVWGDGTGAGIRWEPRHKPVRGWYRCENGCDIEQSDKGWMDAHGEWRAAAPENGPRHRSFHIWAAYPHLLATDWEPVELSMVAVPFDAGAQVRARSASQGGTHPCTIRGAAAASQENTMPDPVIEPAADPAPATLPAVIVPPAAVEPVAGARHVTTDAIITRADKLGADFALGLVKRHGTTPFTEVTLLEAVTEEYAKRTAAPAPIDNNDTRIAVGGPVASGAKFRAAIEAGILSQGKRPSEVSEDARHFRGMRLSEMARFALEAQGRSSVGMRGVDLFIAATGTRYGAHGTSDFGTALANVASKSMRDGYVAAEQTFWPIVRRKTLPDFKPATLVSLSALSPFLAVLENAEFKRLTAKDTGDSFKLGTYGGIFAVIHGVEVALERLVRFAASVGDYASYAALVAATIPPGKWASSLAAGMVRFGAPTQGQVSFLAQGDADGPDGWVRLPGRIINRLALLAGGTGKIDTVSLAALDTACPWNLSLYLDDQVTAREIIQRIAASINAVAGISWLGKLFVAPVGIGTSVLTLNADGSTLPPVVSTKQVKLAPPFWRLAIQSERTWTVHALSDVALASPLYDTSNMIPAPDDQTGWQFANGAIYASIGTDRPAAQNCGDFHTGYAQVFWSKDLDIQAVPDQHLWFAHTAAADGYCLTGTEHVRGGFRCFTAAGAMIGDFDIPGAVITVAEIHAATGGWVSRTAGIVMPAGTAFVCPYSIRPYSTSGTMYVGEARLTPHEPSSDITRVLQLSTGAVAVHLDSDGEPVDGQLPATIRASLIRGGADVSPQASFSITASSTLSASINDTPGSSSRGLITLSDVAADGTITVTATIDGVSRTATIAVDAQQEAPPSGGTTSSQTSFPSVTSSTYDSPAAAFSITGASQRWSVNGIYAVSSGTATLAAKAQYRAVGSGTWIDAGSEVTGTLAYRTGADSEDGYIAGGTTLTGLSGAIEWRLLERRSGGSATTRLVGSLRVTV